MPANHTEIEKKLWACADELRANSHLKSSEYSVPVLGYYLQVTLKKSTYSFVPTFSSMSMSPTMVKARVCMRWRAELFSK